MGGVKNNQEQSGGDNSHNVQVNGDFNVTIAQNADKGSTLIERPTMQDIERFDPKVKLLHKKVSESLLTSALVFSILRFFLFIVALLAVAAALFEAFIK